MKNLSASTALTLSFALFFLPNLGFSDPDLDKTKILFNDGRTLNAIRTGDFMFDLELHSSSGKAIWRKTFGDPVEPGEWGRMYFVRVKGASFYKDINHDGFPEIVVAPFDGGNAVYREVEVYTVFADHLAFLEKKRLNILSREPLLK